MESETILKNLHRVAGSEYRIWTMLNDTFIANKHLIFCYYGVHTNQCTTNVFCTPIKNKPIQWTIF